MMKMSCWIMLFALLAGCKPRQQAAQTTPTTPTAAPDLDELSAALERRDILGEGQINEAFEQAQYRQ